jgi:hypothetical protein
VWSVLDGVYTGFGRDEPLAFRQAAPLRDEEVAKLVGHIRKLILGRLQRLGHLYGEARLDLARNAPTIPRRSRPRRSVPSRTGTRWVSARGPHAG